MSDRKVLAVHRGPHRYSSAYEYGKVVFLTEGKLNIFQTDMLKSKIEEAIDTHAHPKDYLLLSGHIIPNAIAVHAMLHRFGKVQMLTWMGNHSKYKVITIFGR